MSISHIVHQSTNPSSDLSLDHCILYQMWGGMIVPLSHCLGFNRGRHCMIDGQSEESVPNDRMWRSSFVQSVRDAAEGIEKWCSKALHDVPMLEDELKCALILGGIRNRINTN